MIKFKASGAYILVMELATVTQFPFTPTSAPTLMPFLVNLIAMPEFSATLRSFELNTIVDEAVMLPSSCAL